MLADVIAMVVDVITTQGMIVPGRCYNQGVTDGIVTGQHLFQF